MDAQDLELSDLLEVLGNVEVMEQILNGQKTIDIEQARSLAKRLHVDPQVFL